MAAMPRTHARTPARPQTKRKRGIDYSAEVAFEKKAAPGFFDTGEEQDRSKAMQQVRGGPCKGEYRDET